MRWLLGIGVALAVGCTDPFGPGDRLVGTWSSADHRLVATTNEATLVARCYTLQSGPLVLTDSLTFRALAVVTQSGGLVTLRIGDSTSLVGRVDGRNVLVDRDVLRPGAGGVLVCNA